MFNDILARSSLFNLMAAIRREMGIAGCLFGRQPAPERRSDPDPRIGVSGTLCVRDVAADSNYDARCTIIGTVRWWYEPLRVFCHEPWMKPNVEWHQLREDSSWYLCYELPERWEDRIAKVRDVNDILQTIEFAKEFCLRSSRSLIEKHLFAFRQNITRWPPEWEAWPHNRGAAVREFRQELRRAG
jgi:hypothetical protein